MPRKKKEVVKEETKVEIKVDPEVSVEEVVEKVEAEIVEKKKDLTAVAQIGIKYKGRRIEAGEEFEISSCDIEMLKHYVIFK